jgi:hypothetical protein
VKEQTQSTQNVPQHTWRQPLLDCAPFLSRVSCALRCVVLCCAVLPAAEWGSKLITSRDGVGEDGWQRSRLEPEDRQYLTVLQITGEWLVVHKIGAHLQQLHVCIAWF